jgi:hypothetical protein
VTDQPDQHDQPPPDQPPPDPTRRALLGGAALGALAGAGAGGALAAALRDEPAPAATLAPATTGGPWRHVAPGEDLQAAIDAGARAIALGDGTYDLHEPLRPAPGCTIRGLGERTVLRAAADLDAVIAIGAGGPVGGVTVADLVVDAGDRAGIGIDLDIVGTSGNLQGEPDAVCRLDNLWVIDAGLDGIAYRGTDTQACVTSRARVRRAQRHGFRVEAPDNVFLACEATTSAAGGAGFLVGVAVEGSDGIGAANCHFHACKAWYCRGVGWLVTGPRNTFVSCEAQDVAGHGWDVVSPRNSLAACVADSASSPAVGGRAGEADGFSIEPAEDLALVGCLSFDRRPGGAAPAQRHGFAVPGALVDAGLLVAPVGWGLLGDLISRR